MTRPSLRRLFTGERLHVVLLAALMLVALAARIGVALYAEPYRFVLDEREYTAMAYRLLDHGVYSYASAQPNAMVVPGYPLLLAGIFALARVFGGPGADPTMLVHVVQALLGVASVYLAYRLARRLAGPWAGLLAGAVMVAYPPMSLAVTRRYTEDAYVTVLLAFLLAVSVALERKTARAHLLAGALCGLAALFKPVAAALLVAPYLVELVRTRDRRLPAGFALALVGLSVVLAPWWVRNALTFGRFIPLTTQAGDPLLRGADPFDQYNREGLPIFRGTEGRDLAEVAGERIAAGVRTDPVRWIGWYTWGKVWYLWRQPWGGTRPDFMRWHIAVMVAGIAGIVWALRRGEAAWLAVLPLWATVLQLPFIAIPRYAFPMTSVLIVLGAACIVSVFGGARVRGRSRG